MDNGKARQEKERQNMTVIKKYPFEKRKSGRHGCEHSVICKSYDPEKDDFDVTPAVVYNQSRDGLLFHSNSQFEPDTPIHMQLKDELPYGQESELKEGVHARVIWCEKIDQDDHLVTYKVGVEYF
jgi:hypothetical protein